MKTLQIETVRLDVVLTNGDKLYFTLVVDTKSRKIAVSYVSRHPPTVDSVIAALKKAVPKAGKVSVAIQVDNSKEFRSKKLEAYCAKHSIVFQTAPPGQAHVKTVAEAVVGSVQKDVAQLAGTVRTLSQSSPKQSEVWLL